MAQSNDLVRCTNCWEGIEWQHSQRGDWKCQCPRCGLKGQVIQGGFLVFTAEQKGNSEDHTGA
jgi:Zn finger protein HypA/HybF involved in hydrogenase expression